MDRPLISIAVSTDATERGLSNCLASCRNQTLAHRTEVRVYHWVGGPDRSRAIQEARAPLVLLLDADCALPDKNYLARLLATAERYPHVMVWGGPYLSDSRAPYFDRAYNRLCNAWIETGRMGRSSINLTGGCLAIAKDRLPNLTRFPRTEFWGGEDAHLVRELVRQGARAHASTELAVIHRPNNTLRKTLKRAYLHGISRQRLGLNTPRRKAWPHLRSWSDLPFWALHFSAVEIGSIVSRWGNLSSPRRIPNP